MTAPFTKPGYESLTQVLSDAFNQAAWGKGHDRHANGEPFDKQVMSDMARRFGIGSPLGQAFKKCEESQRLPYDAARRELLGAINYIAGAIIELDRLNASKPASGLGQLIKEGAEIVRKQAGEAMHQPQSQQDRGYSVGTAFTKAFAEGAQQRRAAAPTNEMLSMHEFVARMRELGIPVVTYGSPKAD